MEVWRMKPTSHGAPEKKCTISALKEEDRTAGCQEKPSVSVASVKKAKIFGGVGTVRRFFSFCSMGADVSFSLLSRIGLLDASWSSSCLLEGLRVHSSTLSIEP